MLRNELKSLEAVQVAAPGRFLVKSVLAISRFDFRPCEKPIVQGVARGRSGETSPSPAPIQRMKSRKS
jgi:hypothetical protein